MVITTLTPTTASLFFPHGVGYRIVELNFFFRFEDDIEYMTGSRPGWYWKITWRYVAPILVFGILTASIVNMGVKPIVYSSWHPELVSTSRFKLLCAYLR